MGKFLLSIMCALTAILTGYAQDAAYSIPTNGNTTYWPGKSAYTGNEEFTSKDGKWVACNFNTNSINPIRCGSKNAPAVAYIRTANALEETISQVKLTFGKYTTNSVNSLKLYISNTDTFDGEGISPANTPSLTDGCVFDIPTPSANKYYKIVFDMKKGANGDVQLKSGEFFVQTDPNKCALPAAMINGEEIAHGDKAVIYDELSFSCGTEDATISYTITGGNFTGESQTYNGTPIKLDKIGIYTITAKATKDGLTDSDELKIDDLDVVGKTPQMSFPNASIFGKVGTGVVWQKVIITEPNEEKAGAITYSSSDPDVVTVDSKTGQIKPEDVKKAGEARIIATMAQNGDYAEGSAEYLIVVVDPNVPIQPNYTVFDFTTENPYGMTTQTAGTSYEKKIKAISGNNKIVTLDFGGNYRSWNDNNAYFLRMQKSSSIKITVPPGYKITKIGMTGNIDNKSSFTPTSGTISDDTDPDGGKFSAIWVPKDETPISEVTFNAGTSNWSGINKINVMWDAAGSELKSAELTFTPNVNGIYIDDIAEINAVNNPNNRTIVYTIPALAEDEYEIEEVDNNKLHVRVSKPGSYTLEARSAAGDGFRDGFAIMRLNVYRHLTVYANDVELEKDEIDTGSDTPTYVTIDVPENAYLYYRFVDSETPAPAEDTTDENQLPGYTLYEDGIEVPAKKIGKLQFYIANYGYISPVRELSLSFETGVDEIAAESEGAVRIFDLNGREIKGTPEKGVYIRIQNGKATKVVI